MANMMAARQAGAPAGLERRWRAAWAAVGGTWRVAFAAAACASVALAWAWRTASGAVGGEPAHVPATLAIGLVVTGVAAAAAALVDVHEHRLPNALVGRTLVPNMNGATQLVITGNTATTITVAGGLAEAAAVGNRFYVSDYATAFDNVTLDGAIAVDTG